MGGNMRTGGHAGIGPRMRAGGHRGAVGQPRAVDRSRSKSRVATGASPSGVRALLRPLRTTPIPEGILRSCRLLLGIGAHAEPSSGISRDRAYPAARRTISLPHAQRPPSPAVVKPKAGGASPPAGAGGLLGLLPRSARHVSSRLPSEHTPRDRTPCRLYLSPSIQTLLGHGSQLLRMGPRIVLGRRWIRHVATRYVEGASCGRTYQSLSSAEASYG